MFSKRHYLQNKLKAKEIILESLIFFAALYGVKYKKVAIRNQRTRWGSCSKSGNLNFNYKVAFLPKLQRDYVIVHEICHLIEFNHSKRFWAQVERTIPNYKINAAIIIFRVVNFKTFESKSHFGECHPKRSFLYFVKVLICCFQHLIFSY